MNQKTGYYKGDEAHRENCHKDMTTYQWRCTKEQKRKLMKIAAMEDRTANKVLSEALQYYILSMRYSGL